MLKRIVMLGAVVVSISLVLFMIYGAKSENDTEIIKDPGVGTELEQKVLSFTMDGRSSKGVKQWHLEGNSAEIIKDDIYLNDLSAVAYGDTSTIYLTSNNGIYNKEEGQVELMGDVIVTLADGFMLTTERASWSQKTKEIFTDAVVLIKRDKLTAVGTGGKANSDLGVAFLFKEVTVSMEPDTTVYCDGPLELNYNKKIAVFHNNVKVKDKDGKLFSDKLIVEFDPETEQFKQVTAEGNVKTQKGNNCTLSEKAIYTESTKSVRLLGRPRIIIDPQELAEFDGFGGAI